MIFKSFIFFLFIFSLKLPLNSIYDFLIVIILILSLISTKKIQKNEIIKNKLFFVLSLLVLLIVFLIPKNNFQEGHQVFINDNDLKVIEKAIPKEIFLKIYKDFNNNFDFNRLYLSKDSKWTLEYSKDWFTNKRFISNPFAFSVDNFFSSSLYSRHTQSINFSSREDLRIGQINKLNYNFFNDKELRRSLPYFVFFEIPKIAKNSKICSNKNFFYKYHNDKLLKKNINKTKFDESLPGCITYNKSEKFLYIIAYSINLNDNLELKLYENKTLIFIKIIKYILFISLIVFFNFIFYQKYKFDNFIIYLVSIFSTLLLFAIRDINILTGLRYFRGGGDGLLHYAYGREIIENLFNLNFYDALKGGENIFYFMPGLRYYSAFNNLLFGETIYGYVILSSLIPVIVFKIIRLFTNLKWAIILLILFIFLPIFENMGFGYFNYVWQTARYHAEPLSIFLILVSIYILIKNKDFIRNFDILTITSLLSLSTLGRPNFFPTCVILSLYLVFLSIQNKRYFGNLFILIGFSFTFLAFLHNIYFGQSYNLFTISKVHFVFSEFYTNLNIENIWSSKLLQQIYKWNPIFYLHRLIFLIILTYYIIKYKQNLITYALFFCCISQHGVLILTHPDSRYAYLAWLLTFLLFIKIIYENNLLNILRKNKN